MHARTHAMLHPVCYMLYFVNACTVGLQCACAYACACMISRKRALVFAQFAPSAGLAGYAYSLADHA